MVMEVAGFKIRINLNKTEWQYAYEKTKQEIFDNYSGFLVKSDEVDYIIDFVEENTFIINKKLPNKFFINYFEKKNKKVITYYQIGILQFQSILKEIIIELLASNHGFLIHGSASEYKNHSIIFLGENNAGKSTAMSFLHPTYQALADDTVIIRKIDNSYYCFQTPFIEKNYWIKKKAGKYIIDKIFFLKKSLIYDIKDVKDKSKLLNMLIKQFWSSEEYSRKQLKTYLKFIDEFEKFYVLYFGKNKKALINLIELSYV